MTLHDLGWDDRFAEAFAPMAAPGIVPGRVALEHQHLYRVYSEAGEYLAHVAGRFRHRATSREAYPAVGDWIALQVRPGHERATIVDVLPRRSRFSRKAAGDVTEEQVVAANIDTVFLVTGLDGDFNVRRIERYLATAWNGGAEPVVVLNKTDLCEDPEAMVGIVRDLAPGVPVHAMSSLTGVGFDALEPYLQPARTVALLGSSGAGKSTIINRLLGQPRQRTREVREHDSRGRHTTTQREMVRLPGGALLVDTPGMRELQLWEGGALGETFEDIETLAAGCHFRDCRHEHEPKCAVKEAVARGELAPERLESWHRLRREAEVLAARQDERLQQEQRRKTRIVHRSRRLYTPRE